DDARPAVLITQSDYFIQLDDFSGQLFAVDVQMASLPEHPENLPPGGSPADLACVIYTSGSTGQPKGSLNEQRSMTKQVWRQHAQYLAGARAMKMAVVAPYVFDPFGKQVFLALLHGHSLYLVPEEKKRSGEALWAYYLRHGIELTDGTPALLQVLLSALPARETEIPLAYFLIGGAPLPAAGAGKLLDFYAARGLDVTLVNEYGLTECCVDNTCYRVPAQGPGRHGALPIGRPLPNNQLFVLDAHRQPVPVGVPGEICIAGQGLGRGYLNRSGLTAERFVDFSFPGEPSMRVYRTGDRGKWLPDGNLAYLGRQDDQVKVRGFRVEPGEIENRLRALEGVEEAVVVARPDGEDAVLVAYLTGQPDWSSAALRARLGAFLPGYMLPAYFVRLETFPLTLNGKIDKKALPDPLESSRREGAPVEPPRTPLEAGLVRIWEEVLGRKPIGTNENFFEIGGHSLKAVQIASRIFTELHRKVEVTTLFTYPFIAQLAGVLETAAPVQRRPIHPIEEQEYYEASRAQKRLWVLSDQFAFNVSGAYLLEGPFRPEAFAAAFGAFVARHESLRTTLRLIGDSLKQQVLPAGAPGFAVRRIDLRREADPEAAARQAAARERATPFDLAAGPLIRATVLDLDARRYVLLLSMHHTIADGRSLETTARELFALYQAGGRPVALAPLALQHKDYSAWSNARLASEALREHRQYWLSVLADNAPATELPLDFPRPAGQTANGAARDFLIGPAVTGPLNALAAQRKASLFMVLTALVKALAYRYTGQSLLTLGTTTDLRHDQALEHQIGYYINLLPLRTAVGEGDGFADLLARVRQGLLGAYQHREYPFDRLVEDLGVERNPNRSPLFDVLVQLNNANGREAGSRQLGDLRVSAFGPARQEGVLDVMFLFTEQEDGLSLSIHYNADLFRESTIDRLYDDLAAIAKAVGADPNVRLADLPLAASPHEAQVLAGFTGAVSER
ncbi:MAG: AMP-binding protein, partial [Cytophagales bacterium]|nr:AMP-binding protein [Cytophagales bacterium]